MLQFKQQATNSYFSLGPLECSSRKKTTIVDRGFTAPLRTCRPVNPSTTKSTTLLTTKTSDHQNPVKHHEIFLPWRPSSRTSLEIPKHGDPGSDKEAYTNVSVNITHRSSPDVHGVTISMSMLAVIVISATVVIVWVIIAVIVLVRRKRASTVQRRDDDSDIEPEPEFCVLFRSSNQQRKRPTIELRRDSYRSESPYSTLDYTEYTGFHQPITTHIHLDYGKFKKKKSHNNGMLC